jgi:hypothetical protein
VIPIGTYDHPFKGTFDGNGYPIKSLSIVNYPPYLIVDKKYIGLFGYVKDATLENINIENVLIHGEYIEGDNDNESQWEYVGPLAGYISNSTVSNCSVSGYVEIDVDPKFCVGKFVGYADDDSTVDIPHGDNSGDNDIDNAFELILYELFRLDDKMFSVSKNTNANSRKINQIHRAVFSIY